MNQEYSEGQFDDGIVRFMKGTLSGMELLRKETISNVSLLLTYQCPASCAHCIFESSPTNKTVIQPELAHRFIAAAARQRPVPSVSFSGGDPFLQLDLLKTLVGYAKSFNMISEVISSSAWAKSYDYAHNVLGELACRGLKVYCTSVDKYHTAFIPAEKMRNAVMAARDVGLKVSLNTLVDSQHFDEHLSYLSNTLNLPTELISEWNVNPIYVVPVGRAKSSISQFYFKNEKNFNEGCPYSTEIVTLSPSGLLYPCCGMVLGEPPHNSSLFIQDEITENTTDEIEEVLRSVKQDLFFKVLQSAGPYQLLQEVKRRNPEIKTRDRFVGSCDVCLEFTRNTELIDATHEFLLDLMNRGGPANSDSPISDSLAQPKPHGVRQTEEQAHEKDEKESRTGIQGQSGNRCNQGRQDAGRVG